MMTQDDSANDRDKARHEVERLCAVWRAVNISFSNAKERLPDNYDSADLIQVCRYGDLPALKALMAQGIDFHQKDGVALRWAAANGHIDMVNYLLDHEADIHANADGALLSAVINRHFKTVDLLLERGAFFSGLTTEQCEAYDAAQEEERRIATQKEAVCAMAKQSLSEIFNAKTWAGHASEMRALWSEVPAVLQSEIDFSHVLAAVNIQTMKQYRPKIVFKP
jgi:hypothetical protein